MTPEKPRAGPSDSELAIAIVRLIHGRHLSRKTRSAIDNATPRVWGDLARFIEESEGYDSPEKRAESVSTFLARLKGSTGQKTAKAIRDALEAAPSNDPGDEPDEPTATPRQSFRRSIVGVTAFNQANHELRWHIDHALVAGQPAVIGAPKKSMKTSVMVDMAVSLAAGLPFLGHFNVPTPTSVLLLSGESGGFVLRETLRRVCQAKGIAPEELEGRMHIGEELPQLGMTEDLSDLAEFISESGIQVVTIDPLYLCLLQGSVGKRLDPSNLFDVGPLLLDVSRTCLKAGATPALVHHFRKNGAEPTDLPELEDLAYAGIQEFARQWLLMKRRERYEPGSGVHKLWLAVGGSAGHSGEFALDITEGSMDTDFTGRRWDVAVRHASEDRAAARQEQTSEKTHRKVEKEMEKAADDNKRMAQVLAIIKETGGETERAIRTATGWNSDNAAHILYLLEKAGSIRRKEIMAPYGRGQRMSPGFVAMTEGGAS